MYRPVHKQIEEGRHHIAHLIKESERADLEELLKKR